MIREKISKSELRRDEMPKTVTIKLVSVNFVPTIYTVDDSGNETEAPRTVIDQLSFDADELPAGMQIEICALIAEAYREQFTCEFQK